MSIWELWRPAGRPAISFLRFRGSRAGLFDNVSAGDPPELLPNGMSRGFFLEFNDIDILTDNMFSDLRC